MKKNKRIFTVILFALLILCSAAALSSYNVIKNNPNEKQRIIQNMLDDDIVYLTLALMVENDPQTKIVTLDRDVYTEEIENKLNEKYIRIVNEVKKQIQSDANFVYIAKDTETGNILSSNTDRISDEDHVDDYTLYESVTYDENGYMFVNNDVYDYDAARYTLSVYLPTEYSYEFEEEGVYVDDTFLPLDDIRVNVPEHMEFTFIVPEKILAENSTIANYMVNWYNYEWLMLPLFAGAMILLIFLLLYPIRIVEDTQPFKTMRQWKLELLTILLTFVITLCSSGCILLGGYTINGRILAILNANKLPYADLLLLCANFIMWFITFYCISIAIFAIKYIFAHGFLQYLKYNTCIGSFLRYLKHKIDKIAEIDLREPLTKQIMLLIVINTIVICVITLFGPFGCILALIYAFICFFWIKDKGVRIEEDYYKLLCATKELAKGNFDDEIYGDVGIFHGLRDEFRNIKSGFEKAVKEETKSQNMKTELISNVSHDLKTPLTCIKNYVVLLHDDTLSDEQRTSYLQELDHYTNRLTTLIEDLFEVSKVNSGNIQLECSNFNITALIEQMQAECGEMLDEQHLQIIASFASRDIMVNLDANKTSRIFENLFTNIAKYAMPYSRVYIDVTENDVQVKIQFKNMSKDQMNFTPEEITERFVRGDKSRHESGSGLGLAIVKSFTEVQGGQFQIDIDGDLFKSTIIFQKGLQQEQQTS